MCSEKYQIIWELGGNNPFLNQKVIKKPIKKATRAVVLDYAGVHMIPITRKILI